MKTNLLLIPALVLAIQDNPSTATQTVSAPVASVVVPLSTRTADEGLLEYAYFPSVPDMVKAHRSDFFWAKPGLSLKGCIVSSKAWEAKVLRVGRRPEDLERAKGLARMLSESLRTRFQEGSGDLVTWQLGGDGDFSLEGRVVDANVPNTVSKLMFGWLGGKENLENSTFDLKLVDMRTGETVLAAHHRIVKVNTLGSLDASLRSWTADFAKDLLTILL